MPLLASGANAAVLRGAPTCEVVSADVLPFEFRGHEGTVFFSSASFAVEGGEAVANSAGTHQFAAGESRLVASFAFTINTASTSVATGPKGVVGWRRS